MSRFLRRRTAVLGLFMVAFVVSVAVAAPVIAPYPPNKTVSQTNQPPSTAHWLGTDQVGRDLLSRIIFGARISLIVGVGAQLIGAIIGILLGMAAGYFGGRIDVALMRIIDVFMAFPFILLAILLVAALEPSTENVILAIGLTSWTPTCRLIRGQTLLLREELFVDAARVVGASQWRIIFRHIFPNLLPIALTMFTIGIGTAILAESSLSYLGLGIQPPTSSWGEILSFGQNVVFSAPQLTICPTIAILITVLGFNLLGDGLRDAFDPRDATLRGQLGGG
jgi:peptide/nickel transport system permease protein